MTKDKMTSQIMKATDLKERKTTIPRLYFLDYLRTALVVLVIYTHTCIAYGGEGSWGYRSKHHPRSFPLSVVNGLAQTFFMGAFFFLSVRYLTFLSFHSKRLFHNSIALYQTFLVISAGSQLLCVQSEETTNPEFKFLEASAKLSF